MWCQNIDYNTVCFVSRILHSLGSGQFGEVNKGVWQSPHGPVEVAVKTLKRGASEEDAVRFLQEAAIMGQFRHPNIVELLGVVTLGERVRVNHACHSKVLPNFLYVQQMYFNMYPYILSKGHDCTGICFPW